MPGIEPQQDSYGLAPATDTMSVSADEPEAMPTTNAGPVDLTVDDAQPAPPLADEQHRRAAAARSLAALNAAVAQMERDRAPPAQSARAALDHIDAPDRYAHHIETGKSAVRLQARLAGQPNAQAEAAANDYQSAIHLTHVDARASDDAIGALVAIRRHGADMRPDDRHKALAGIAPRFADERAIADVEAGDLAAAPFAPQAPKMAPDDLRDRMLAISPDEQQAVLPTLLQRYKGDAARSWAAAALGPEKLDALIAQHGDGWYPALPEDVRVDVAQHIALLGARGSKRALPADPAAAATRIVNRPGVDDERRQKALDELNWRMMQTARAGQIAAAGAAAKAQAAINQLGDRFTSIAQIPPSIRRDLSKEAIDGLVRQARGNILPTTQSRASFATRPWSEIEADSDAAELDPQLADQRWGIEPAAFTLHDEGGPLDAGDGAEAGPASDQPPEHVRNLDDIMREIAGPRAPTPSLSKHEQTTRANDTPPPAAAGKLQRSWPIPGYWGRKPGQTPLRGDRDDHGVAYSDGSFHLKRPFPRGKAHKGDDLPGPVNVPVHAAADGVVSAILTQPNKIWVWARDKNDNLLMKKGKPYKIRKIVPGMGGYGHYIKIRHPDGYTTLYGHLRDVPPLKVGMRIRIGQEIGILGKTGNAAQKGSHVHFEVQDKFGNPIDPALWISGGAPTQR